MVVRYIPFNSNSSLILPPAFYAAGSNKTFFSFWTHTDGEEIRIYFIYIQVTLMKLVMPSYRCMDYRYTYAHIKIILR